jgi:hypothetical protein
MIPFQEGKKPPLGFCSELQAPLASVQKTLPELQ